MKPRHYLAPGVIEHHRQQSRHKQLRRRFFRDLALLATVVGLVDLLLAYLLR